MNLRNWGNIYIYLRLMNNNANRLHSISIAAFYL